MTAGGIPGASIYRGEARKTNPAWRVREAGKRLCVLGCIPSQHWGTWFSEFQQEILSWVFFLLGVQSKTEQERGALPVMSK